MKRKKEVFKVSELVHIFVNQTQDSGKSPRRSTSGWVDSDCYSRYRQMFFNEKKLWAYGTHYQLAELHCNDNVLLINSEKSSNTTEDHKRLLTRAGNHLKIFSVPNLDNPKDKENIEYLNNLIFESLDLFIRSRAYSEHDYKRMYFHINTYNEYCKTFKIKDKIENNHGFNLLINELLEYKQNKFKKVLEKREKKTFEKNKSTIIKSFVRVKNWLQFKTDSIYNIQLNTVFLRVNIEASELETSWGACVDLKDALKLYNSMKTGINVIGNKIDGFEITKIEKDFIQVGCHTIKMRELDRVLGSVSLNKLKVV